MKAIKRRVAALEKQKPMADPCTNPLWMRKPINGDSQRIRCVWYQAATTGDEAERQNLITELVAAYEMSRPEIETGIDEYRAARGKVLKEDDC